MKKTIVLSALVAAFALVGWIEKGMANDMSTYLQDQMPLPGVRTTYTYAGNEIYTNHHVGPDTNNYSTYTYGTDGSIGASTTSGGNTYIHY